MKTPWVMGLDLSLTSTGLVVLDAEADIQVHCTITIRAERRGFERTLAMADQISERVFETPVALAAIEGYSYGARRRQSQLASLGELGGLVKRCLVDACVPYVVVAPASLKKFATGRGNAKKDELRLAVYKKWNVELPTTDEIDAYVLARMALVLVKESQDEILKYEREALEKVY